MLSMLNMMVMEISRFHNAKRGINTMNKHLFLLLTFILASVSCVSKTPRFTDYLQENGKGMAIIKAQTKHDMSKENVHETLSEQIKLAEILLNQAVWRKALELSKDEDYNSLKDVLNKHECFPNLTGRQRYFIERHLAWLEFFKKVSSGTMGQEGEAVRDVMDLKSDLSCVEARLEAVGLPFEQFKLYETIANNARIHLRSGDHPLCFGEIRLKETLKEMEPKNKGEDQYRHFSFSLLSPTCIEFADRASNTCLAAVIRRREAVFSAEITTYYLHVWDNYGNPVETWLLGDNGMLGKITAVESLSYDDGTLHVVFKVHEQTHQKDYAFNALPKAGGTLEEENIGKRKLDRIHLTDDAVKDSLDFLNSIKYNFMESEAKETTRELFDSRKCSVTYVDGHIASYRIEARNYGGGGISTTIAVGTIARMGEQKELELSDIVTKEEYPKMTELIRNELMKLLKVRSYVELQENLFCDPFPINNFFYDGKGLHFVYNQGEIGPMGLGAIEICIQWPLPRWIRGYGAVEDE